MKAQVTTEYLMLSLVSIILIALAVSALFSITQFWSASREQQTFLIDKNIIEKTVEEVCILGNGNSRVVHLRGIFNETVNSTCEVSAQLPLSGSISISNNNGIVEIKVLSS